MPTKKKSTQPPNRTLNQLKWFYPGIRIKRWIALIILGAIIYSLGAVFIIGKNLPRDFYLLVTSHIRQGIAGISLALTGAFLILYGVKRLHKRIISIFLPHDDSHLIDLLYRDTTLRQGHHIVVIGGGTGLHSLLRGLKQYTSNLTAIVTVSDDGGSSGRLREEMQIPPPGDIRQCIAALADSEDSIAELFSYRLTTEGPLNGHSIGNLLLAAMTEIKHGDFHHAIRELSHILAVRGTVIPSTTQNVTLCAELHNGTIISGETNIAANPQPINRVFLSPPDCHALPEAIDAIHKADIILIGPGSLYTSIIPNLLVHEILTALRTTTAPLVYICNIMTQPGETDTYTASDHAAQIIKLLGRDSLDYIILNNKYPSRLLQRYKDENQTPVTVDPDNLQKLGISHTILADLIREDELVRHDPQKLAQTIIEIAQTITPIPKIVPFATDIEKIRGKLMNI